MRPQAISISTLNLPKLSAWTSKQDYIGEVQTVVRRRRVCRGQLWRNNRLDCMAATVLGLCSRMVGWRPSVEKDVNRLHCIAGITVVVHGQIGLRVVHKFVVSTVGRFPIFDVHSDGGGHLVGAAQLRSDCSSDIRGRCFLEMFCRVQKNEGYKNVFWLVFTTDNKITRLLQTKWIIQRYSVLHTIYEDIGNEDIQYHRNNAYEQFTFAKVTFWK